jgi:hypothetical protein
MSLRTKHFRALLALPVIAMTASWPALAETEAERQACSNDAQVHCADQTRPRPGLCLPDPQGEHAVRALQKIISTAIRGSRVGRCRGSAATTAMTMVTFAASSTP